MKHATRGAMLQGHQRLTEPELEIILGDMLFTLLVAGQEGVEVAALTVTVNNIYGVAASGGVGGVVDDDTLDDTPRLRYLTRMMTYPRSTQDSM